MKYSDSRATLIVAPLRVDSSATRGSSADELIDFSVNRGTAKRQFLNLKQLRNVSAPKRWPVKKITDF